MELKITISPRMDDLMARLRGDIQEGMAAAMTTLVETVEAYVKKETPVRKSNLLNSITSHVENQGQRGIINAGAPYAAFVHFGTGLYGPLGKKIVPKTAKALLIPGIGFRKSVKGMKPNPFMQRGLGRVTDPASVYEGGIVSFLRKKGW